VSDIDTLPILGCPCFIAYLGAFSLGSFITARRRKNVRVDTDLEGCGGDWQGDLGMGYFRKGERL
jgi:hypothetical protein